MAQPGGHRLLQVLFVYQPHDEDRLGQADHQESHAHDEVDTYAPQDGAGWGTHMGGRRGAGPSAPGSSPPGAGLTDERRADGRGGQRVGHDDQEDRVAQEERDLEGNSLTTVRRQIEAHDVHDHEEDTGQKQADRIEEGPSADDHLDRERSSGEWGQTGSGPRNPLLPIPDPLASWSFQPGLLKDVDKPHILSLDQSSWLFRKSEETLQLCFPNHFIEDAGHPGAGKGLRRFFPIRLLKPAGVCPTHIELHLCVAVTAFYTELLELGQHPQQLPLALVHEDAPVELHLFRQAP